MRVVHIVDSLEIGGMERLIVDLVKLQLKRNHKVIVICLLREGKLAKELQLLGITVNNLKKPGGFSLRTVLELRKILGRFECDALHTHNPVSNFYGALAAKMAGIKVVVNTRHGMGNIPLNFKKEILFKFSSFFCTNIVCVCESAKNNFVKHRIVSPKKVSVIYNGIELNKFSNNMKNVTKLFDEFGLNRNDLVVGTVARLEPVKNIELLIKSFRDISKDRQNIKLLIVGDGSQMENLKALVEEFNLGKSVIFANMRSDVPDLMKLMHVFVLPSLSEGMSLTLIEAMAAGLAVIASDVGGNREVVENRISGFIFPSNDVDKLSEVLNKVTNDYQMRTKIGHNAKMRAFNSFSLEIMADKYDALYAQN